ncbi:hypothetical protein M2271_002394 [Streptomyces sp. LBL]|nr:hypothetical protein [Streptomyces sp. LBL]
MPEYGYFLSCEQYGPAELVEQARMAEQAGFQALWISDHYLPTPSRKRPFVITVLVSATCATTAGWIRTVGQVTAVSIGRDTASDRAPITDQTNGLWPCSSFHGWTGWLTALTDHLTEHGLVLETLAGPLPCPR